ncbi:hypothetical protein GGQ84_001611 [Desulfitispora alkaliphila]|uniref:hypothetical protein n=1 Tax=Desulfitispora alkaliphila TaxID=622674 RepID=UPI003D206FF4
MKKIQLLVMLGILAFIVSSCNWYIADSEGLSYENIISNQYSNPGSNMEVEEILWEKTINDDEIILLFLNKEKTISIARLANVNNKWKAKVSVPTGRSGDEVISWQWSLLSNPSDEDKPEVAAVAWGYIYSPDVEKILVGSDKQKESFREAQLLEFKEQNKKLYYFLTDDDTGFEHDTIIAYDSSGNVLYINRNLK